MTQKLTYRGTPHVSGSPTLNMQAVSVSYFSSGKSFAREKTNAIALEKITFQAKAGEQIAIIGPNGAGKSTLLKVAAGILKPDSGSVKMFGYTPDKHICIAYVPQRNQVDWSFPVTVSDVVMMGRVGQLGLFRNPKTRDWELVNGALEVVRCNTCTSMYK